MRVIVPVMSTIIAGYVANDCYTISQFFSRTVVRGTTLGFVAFVPPVVGWLTPTYVERTLYTGLLLVVVGICASLSDIKRQTIHSALLKLGFEIQTLNDDPMNDLMDDLMDEVDTPQSVPLDEKSGVIRGLYQISCDANDCVVVSKQEIIIVKLRGVFYVYRAAGEITGGSFEPDDIVETERASRLKRQQIRQQLDRWHFHPLDGRLLTVCSA